MSTNHVKGILRGLLFPVALFLMTLAWIGDIADNAYWNLWHWLND